jgi:hypothetical protein
VLGRSVFVSWVGSLPVGRSPEPLRRSHTAQAILTWLQALQGFGVEALQMCSLGPSSPVLIAAGLEVALSCIVFEAARGGRTFQILFPSAAFPSYR